MKRFKTKNMPKYTITKILGIVFFWVLIIAIILFNMYSKSISKDVNILVNNKLDKIIYQFFNECITNDVINNDVSDIIKISKNSKEEIYAVNYDLEKTYKLLTDISNILSKGITDLEKGKIDVSIYDEYLSNGNKGLILNIPVFLNSKNIFMNNMGPKIPVLIKFNTSILTNINTKVTNYGFNNALLEVYVNVSLKKLIITPMDNSNENFNYNILIASLVVNGSVPKYYGDGFDVSSNILDIPINNSL